MRKFWRKLLRRRTLERDLEAELAFHREMAAAGGNPIPLGNAARIKEHQRDFWRFTAFENLWRDVVYGVRGLRRNPTLVATAALSLALGIGANAAIFSLAVEFLFSKPSVADAGSVVSVSLGGNSASLPPVVEYIRKSGVFADVAGENEESFANFNDGTATRPLFASLTTKNFFTALGIPMAYGRGILPDDPDEVVVLDNRFWRQRFHGDPAIVGRTIDLESKPYTVVGILPGNHRTLEGFGYSPDVYMPRYLDDTYLAIYARLKPGMTRGQALAGLRAVAERLNTDIPQPYKYTEKVTVTPISGLAHLTEDSPFQGIGIFFALLLAVTGLVLLIACVNVAGLLLARASARKREIATRLSLGASRARLLQQLVVESLLLAVLGAACGLAMAQAATALLSRMELPLPFPVHLQIEPDWRLALYALALTMGATIACGLLPAWQAAKESLAPDLRRERKMRLRRTLVIAQLALSLVVLTTGFLFLRNLLRANAITPGFDVRHTIRAEAQLPPLRYQDPEQILLYAGRALREMTAIPGIQAAAAARVIPFRNRNHFGSVLTFSDTGEKVHADFYRNVVTQDYFKAMDIPFLQGGTFANAERNVAIVNRAFVASFLHGRAPVGTEFLWGPKDSAPIRIVGVVEGTKNVTIGEDDQPQLFQPFSQVNDALPHLQFVLRSALPPVSQLDAVRQVLRRVDPAAGVDVETMYSSIGLALLPSQVGAVLMGSVGVLGLLLASIGLYGTLVYTVTRRTHEIGIRMALGATRANVCRMILFDSARLVALGSAAGLAVAFFVTKPLAMFLVPGLQPADPISFLAVAALLSATGLAASWGPLRRALAIDPASCLRYD
ncbi:MAG TPA: ABC transporter permease [Bryobacteraceae bacterium]|jgi:predicted permease